MSYMVGHDRAILALLEALGCEVNAVRRFVITGGVGEPVIVHVERLACVDDKAKLADAVQGIADAGVRAQVVEVESVGVRRGDPRPDVVVRRKEGS